MLERRRVLQAFAAGAAFTLVPAGTLTITHGQFDAPHPGYSLRNKFSLLLGTHFRMTDANGVTSTAELVEVDDGPDYPGLDQFSVVFEGDDLSEGLYESWHGDTGNIPISLMPSGMPGSKCNRQRAYFSLLV